MWHGNRKMILGMGVLAALAAACGPSKKGRHENVVVDPTTIPRSYGTPQTANYRMADAECAKGEGASSLETGTFFTFLGGRVNGQSSALNGFSGVPSLHSGGVNQTKVGMVGQQSCDGDTCSSDLQISNPGYPLKLCKAEADYPRDSIEGISLTTLVHLNNVMAFYQGVGGTNPALGNVDMMVMPTFTSGEGATRELKMDNLSYYPTLEGKPYVVVFPKSRLGQQLWPNFNLWESPWVIAHEASHHVFRTNFLSNAPVSSLAAALRDASSPIISLPKAGAVAGEGHGHADGEGAAYLASNLAGRRVTLTDFVGAVNEGFADLFGYYSVGERKDITTDFTCFRKTRDVASPVFADDTKKAFTNEILGVFLANDEKPTRMRTGVPTCEMPNFQGIHSMGAVFAYAFDQLLAKSPKVLAAPNATVAKANLSLEWVRRISRLGALKADQEGFGRILRTAVDTAAAGEITAEQCRLVRELFPAYASDWMKASQVYGPALKCS